MIFTKSNNINLVIPRMALEAVFDECDRHDADETGGRILGTYQCEGNGLTVTVNGVIEPGPNAARSPTYFKQDGDYQEQVFRQVEEREPTVEHLGNWHTHHVNGLRHLSEGDIETYRRTVEHRNHNTDFFHALLVVEKKHGKKGLERYVFKNYVLRRGDSKVYEIPAAQMSLVDDPLLWPVIRSATARKVTATYAESSSLKTNRIHDRDMVSLFYPKIATFKSKELGVYWRGPLALIDGSELETIVLEDVSGTIPEYTVTLRNAPAEFMQTIEALAKERYSSCREALVATERMCNAELYETRANRRRRRWIF